MSSEILYAFSVWFGVVCSVFPAVYVCVYRDEILYSLKTAKARLGRDKYSIQNDL